MNTPGISIMSVELFLLHIALMRREKVIPQKKSGLMCKFPYNILRPRQHGRHFADDTFKCIFLNENVIISIKISLKCVPKGSINNIPALFQMMAWRRPGDKPLSEAMIVSLLTHICVTRPQWVKKEIWNCFATLHTTANVTLGDICKINEYINEKTVSVQVLACCLHATSHVLKQSRQHQK